MQWIHNNYYWVVYVYVSVVWCSAVFLFCVRFARRQTRDRRHIESIKIGDIMQFENGEKKQLFAIGTAWELQLCADRECATGSVPPTPLLIKLDTENTISRKPNEKLGRRVHSLAHSSVPRQLSITLCALCVCLLPSVDCRPEMNTLQMLLRLLFWIILFFIASHFVTCEIFCNFERRWCYNCAPAQTHDLRSHSEFNKLFLSAVCVYVFFFALVSRSKCLCNVRVKLNGPTFMQLRSNAESAAWSTKFKTGP